MLREYDSPPPPCLLVKIWSHPEIARLRTSRGPAWGAFVGRLVLAAVFMYAGTLKILNPQEFLLDVRSFQLLGDPWAAFLSLGLPWLEVFCALALILGGWWRGACGLIAGMLIVFGLAFVQAWMRDLDVTCGCFGKSENKTNFAQSLTIDATLLGLTALVWWGRSRLESIQKNTLI